MKIKVQAQHLQPGDIVGSGERVTSICINSVQWPSSKIALNLEKGGKLRSCYWGKYTMINVEREG